MSRGLSESLQKLPQNTICVNKITHSTRLIEQLCDLLINPESLFTSMMRQWMFCWYGSYSDCSGIVSVSDMMGTFLFVWSTGCEASSEVKGCEGGWVELTCKYPKADQEYQKIEVIKPRGSSIQTTKKDVWEKDDRFSLYHDTRNKNLRMAIKQLKSDDSGEYQCKFYPRPHSSPETQKLELKVGKRCCICIKEV